MLLNAVIIILREVLEASLVISVFLALSQLLERNLRWMLIAMLLGAFAAYVYAENLSYVSMSLEGVGQEVINACLHAMIFISLLVFMISVPHQHKKAWRIVMLVSTMSAVIVAIAREGSEIMLYIGGFAGLPDMLQPVLIGAIVGAGIGISVGVYFFYLLVNLHHKHGLWLGYFILLLVSGSMMSQAIEFLIQANLIEATKPLWDSSSIVSERSAFGQLLYALIGYEATPAPIQVAAYFSSIAVVFVAAAVSFQLRKSDINA